MSLKAMKCNCVLYSSDADGKRFYEKILH